MQVFRGGSRIFEEGVAGVEYGRAPKAQVDYSFFFFATPKGGG